MQYYLTEPGRSCRVVSERDLVTAAFIITGKEPTEKEYENFLDHAAGIERELTPEEMANPAILIGYGAKSLAIKVLYDSDKALTLVEAKHKIDEMVEYMNGGVTH